MHSEEEHLKNESSTPVDPVPAKCPQCGHRIHTGEFCLEKHTDIVNLTMTSFCNCKYGAPQDIADLGGALGTQIDPVTEQEARDIEKELDG